MPLRREVALLCVAGQWNTLITLSVGNSLYLVIEHDRPCSSTTITAKKAFIPISSNRNFSFLPLLLAPSYQLPTTNRSWENALLLFVSIVQYKWEMRIFALINNYIGELQICLGSFLATLWIYGPQGKSTELVIRAYEMYWFINCINPITFTQYCNEMTHWFYLISKMICKLNCSLNISLVTPKLYPWNG